MCIVNPVVYNKHAAPFDGRQTIAPIEWAGLECCDLITKHGSTRGDGWGRITPHAVGPGASVALSSHSALASAASSQQGAMEFSPP